MKEPATLQGTGLGLRREIIPQLLGNNLQAVDFFEIAPENWLNLGGKYQQQLRGFSERFPISCHGLSLSIGSADQLNEALLHNIRKFMDAHNMALYTEHLSWCSYDGQLYDLLPIPFTDEAVHWVAQRLRRAQDILQRQIGIENSSYYVVPPESHLREEEFINAVLAESGAFLHLDVNNLYVNSTNLNYDPQDFLKAINPDHVGYMHVAGHYVENNGWIVDTHGAAVADPVWRLLEQVFQWLGPRSNRIGTCLERDFNFPPLTELLREMNVINSLRDKAQHTSSKIA